MTQKTVQIDIIQRKLQGVTVVTEVEAALLHTIHEDITVVEVDPMDAAQDIIMMIAVIDLIDLTYLIQSLVMIHVNIHKRNTILRHMISMTEVI